MKRIDDSANPLPFSFALAVCQLVPDGPYYDDDKDHNSEDHDWKVCHVRQVSLFLPYGLFRAGFDRLYCQRSTCFSAR